MKFCIYLAFYLGSGGLLLPKEERRVDPLADQAEKQDGGGPAPGNTGLLLAETRLIT